MELYPPHYYPLKYKSVVVEIYLKSCLDIFWKNTFSCFGRIFFIVKKRWESSAWKANNKRNGCNLAIIIWHILIVYTNRGLMSTSG